MKNAIISSFISVITVLLAQNHPALFILFAYIGIGYLSYLKIFTPGIDDMNKYNNKWESGDYVAAVFMSIMWPISSIVVVLSEYKLFKKLYNLPSWRMPFYWEK